MQLHVSRLSYVYASGEKALDNVSLQVAAGECVGLVGPNGAGKTTFFLCVAGVLNIPQGVIQVAGLDPSPRDQRRLLPTKIGIVFQDSDDQLFSTTVADDVAFGPLNLGLPLPEARQRVGEALNQVGLNGFENRVPFHLSGGEKRRVALAGVLAMRPEILLLDEPSSHLDPRGRRELIGLVNSLSVTKLIASHDLEFILETCQRVIILDGGRVMADGPVRKLLSNPTLMSDHGLEVPHSLTPHVISHHPTKMMNEE
jgi:cobalt/nickel transport system ATP-binding protein